MSKLKTYLVLRPIGMAGRVEAGSQVQLTEEEANNYPPDFLKEVKDDESSDVGGVGSQTKTSDEDLSTDSAGNQDGGQKTVDHVVTQEDLDNDPNLAATGIAIGQTIQVPAGE